MSWFVCLFVSYAFSRATTQPVFVRRTAKDTFDLAHTSARYIISGCFGNICQKNPLKHHRCPITLYASALFLNKFFHSHKIFKSVIDVGTNSFFPFPKHISVSCVGCYCIKEKKKHEVPSLLKTFLVNIVPLHNIYINPGKHTVK